MEYDCFKREWIKHVDTSKLELYSLQFANCQRILENNVVYLFDEVGSGKTISAGLMAMECLETLEGNVLIISTPSVAGKKGSIERPFLDDWYSDKGNKGKFTRVINSMGWSQRIEITNNWHSNIRKVTNKEYALVIIDEAHLFLDNNGEKKMREELEKIKCKKIVFSTATPIKTSIGDLKQYIDIASKMLVSPIEPEKEFEKLEAILTSGKDEKSLPCCVFDPSNCATRYFKDTISRLTDKGFERTGARRKDIEYPWKMNEGISEFDYLAEKVNEVIDKDNQRNRFIIFTWLIKDAKSIGNAFEQLGYANALTFGTEKNECKSYAVVTGENKEDLHCFTDKGKKETDILITTVGLSEVGVNFPRFNCVLNYHISAYPSNLEQRFGRVDRINSEYPDIHMYYFLGKRASSEENYWISHYRYLRQILPIIPVKNVLLTKKNIEELITKRTICEEKIKQLKGIKDKIKSFVCGQSAAVLWDELEEDERELCNDEEIEIGERQDLTEEEKKSIQSFIEEKIKEYRLMKLTDDQISIAKKTIEFPPFSIFYNNQTGELRSITPDKCTENVSEAIKDKEDFQNQFKEVVKLPQDVNYVVEKYGNIINDAFEEHYKNNNFKKIFPIKDSSETSYYKELLNELLKESIKDDSRLKFAINNGPTLIIEKLRFFTDFDVFTERLKLTIKRYERYPSEEDYIERAIKGTIFETYGCKYSETTENNVVSGSRVLKLAYEGLKPVENGFNKLICGEKGIPREWIKKRARPSSGDCIDDRWTGGIRDSLNDVIFYNPILKQCNHYKSDAVWNKYIGEINKNILSRINDRYMRDDFSKLIVPEKDKNDAWRCRILEDAIYDVVSGLDKYYLLDTEFFGLGSITYIRLFQEILRDLKIEYKIKNGDECRKKRKTEWDDYKDGYRKVKKYYRDKRLKEYGVDTEVFDRLFDEIVYNSYFREFKNWDIFLLFGVQHV